MSDKKLPHGFHGETPEAINHANPPKPLDPEKSTHTPGVFACVEPEHVAPSRHGEVVKPKAE